MPARRMLVVIAGGALGAPALAQPEFIVAPLDVPDRQSGARPMVMLFGHIDLDGLDGVVQMSHIVSEQEDAYEVHAASPTGGGRADYTVGLEWEAGATRIGARVYATSDVRTELEGESSEVFVAATIASPDLAGPGSGREPRFTLTEDALVHVRFEAHDALSGGISSNNTSYFLGHVDPDSGAIGLTIQDALPSQPQFDLEWASVFDEAVTLPAGDYHLSLSVVHLGTAATIPGLEFGPAMTGDGEVRAELRILPGCSLADLAGPFGVLDFSDVAAFLSAFGASEPQGDLASPIGDHDFSDVVAFLAAFGAGCP